VATAMKLLLYLNRLFTKKGKTFATLSPNNLAPFLIFFPDFLFPSIEKAIFLFPIFSVDKLFLQPPFVSTVSSM
jgi:hypothetical protein